MGNPSPHSKRDAPKAPKDLEPTPSQASQPSEGKIVSSASFSEANLRDFPDWFSPALVKDLRRALNTRGFQLTFLALVIALSLFSASLMNWGADSESIQAIWLPIGVVLMFVQPLRGLNAIAEERKLNTLALIQLTRLSSFKILFGKWTALAFQTGLMSVALLPYFVIGHFVGGFEFFSSVLFLVGITLSSLLLTALMVATSVLPNIITRLIIALVILYLSYLGSSSLYEEYFEGGYEDLGELVLILSGVVLLVGFLVYYLLSAGASQLAITGSENHATMRRLVAFDVALLLSTICWNLATVNELILGEIIPEDIVRNLLRVALYFLLFLSLVVMIDCLVDPAGTSVRTVRYLRRWPKLISYLFVPGWAFGWMFVLIFVPLAMFGSAPAFEAMEAANRQELIIYLFILTNVLAFFLWGAAGAVFVPKFRRRPLFGFVISLFVLLLIAGILELTTEFVEIDSVMAYHPLHNGLLLEDEYRRYRIEMKEIRGSLVSTAILVFLPVMILFFCSRPFRKQYRLQIEQLKESEHT